jgi:aryl-alcohol dehydrogenase-like predicted oxidoreductase
MMQQRKLGTQGLTVSALGLGCMGMTWAYGTDRDENESNATIHEAIDLGVNFFDTAEVYGPFTNELLVGKALKGRRDKVVIASKFGFVFNEAGQITGADSRPEHICEAVNGSLTRLGTDYIDLLYQHRVDPNVPIEEAVGVMAEFVRAGKVRYLGLSEAGPGTLRRAMKVHPISALQSEYSLFEREVEAEILPACRELGIGFVPYSPLGRGLITGQVKRAEEYAADNDNRRSIPRFQGENFDQNMKRVEAMKALAAKKGITPGQLALVWLLHQGEDIVPIPGTKRRKYLRENVASANFALTSQDRKYLEESLPPVAGNRYSDQAMKMIDRG